MRHEESAAAAYGNLPESELRDFIHGIDYLKTAVFPHPDYPTVHWQQSSQSRERPLNVVIILEESLGYGFVEQGLTPRLSAWAEQGWWFDQLYATGIRSVRGIEAVTAGFLPTPARSTVKLSLSQRHFSPLPMLSAAMVTTQNLSMAANPISTICEVSLPATVLLPSLIRMTLANQRLFLPGGKR